MDQMNIFEFATPEWLWLLCAVPAIYIVYGIMALYSRRKLSKMGNIATLKELIPNRSKARELIKLTILALAVALLALAAARRIEMAVVAYFAHRRLSPPELAHAQRF